MHVETIELADARQKPDERRTFKTDNDESDPCRLV